MLSMLLDIACSGLPNCWGSWLGTEAELENYVETWKRREIAISEISGGIALVFHRGRVALVLCP